MNILIAEDDKFISAAYRVKLAKQGWEVTIVADGREVIEHLKSHQPDLILLDLIMPNMDGFEVLEQIQKMPGKAKTPIIVASNLGQKEDIDRAIALGAVDFVVKSEMSMESLVAKIAKFKSK